MLFELTVAELKKRRKNIMGMIILTLVPIIIILFANIYINIIKKEVFGEKFKIAVVDMENSFYTRLFIDKVTESPSIKGNIGVLRLPYDDAMTMLSGNKIAGFIVIPDEFTKAAMQSGEYKQIDVFLNSNMPFESDLIKRALNSGTYIMNSVQNSLYSVYEYLEKLPIEKKELEKLFNIEMLSMVTSAMNRNDMLEKSTGDTIFNISTNDYYCLLIILSFITLLSISSSESYNSLKKSKIIERGKVLGVKDYYFILSVVLSSALVLFLQGFVLLASYSIAGGTSFKGILCFLFMLLLISLSLSFLNVSISTLISKNINLAAVTVINTAVLLLSGLIIPNIYFSKELKNFSVLSPFNIWFNELLNIKAGIYAVNPNILISFTIIIAFSLLVIMKEDWHADK